MKQISNCLKPVLSLTIFLLSLFGSSSIAQDDRDAAIDLTASSGRYVWINDENSSKNIVSGDFTVECWVKITDGDFNIFRFVSKDSKVSFSYMDDDHFRVFIKNSKVDTYWDLDNLSNSKQFKNQWRHVAFVYDGNKNVRIYIDGDLIKNTNLCYSNCSKYIDRMIEYPNHSGDGKCEIGGGGFKGQKGKAYVSEFRVWDDNLSSSTISKYYNEEVNNSHPDWGDLKRYYTGTQMRNSNTEFTDVVNNYHGRQSSGDVNLTDQYPPVHPPAFNNNTFNVSVNANDCQTSSVGISWTDIESNGNYERSNTDVAHALFSSADSYASPIYTGRSSSYTDNSLSAGDKVTYRLYTYWNVNGVKKYSDDYVSNSGSRKSSYNAPSSLTVSSGNCDGTIDIDWTYSGDNPPKWKIERAKNDAFTNSKVTLSSNISSNSSSFTDATGDLETTYYYRVIATGNDGNGCSVIGSYSEVKSGYASQVPAAPNSFNLSQDNANEEIDLTWSSPNGNNHDGFIINRTDKDGSNPVQFTTGPGVTSYTDNTVAKCQTYIYTIATENECATDGIFSSIERSGLISNDLSSSLASFEASKAYYTDEVRLQWTMNGSLSEIERFNIYRSKAGENNYNLIKVVTNDLIFDDETAVGGVLYDYKIEGEAQCEGTTVTTNPLYDVGFILPYGVANGHIEYEGGNVVEDVVVNFERESGATGRSLSYPNSGEYVRVEDAQNLRGTDNNAITIEAWAKFNSFGTRYLFYKNSYYMYVNSNKKMNLVVRTNNGTTTLTCDSVLTASQYYHFAGSYDGDSLKIYIDGKLAAGKQFTGTINDSENSFLYLGYNVNGNMDEIRVWNIARTDEEIATDHQRVINSGETGLVGYWRCDEGVGSAVYDASKTGENFNKNDGRFIGGSIAFGSDIPTTSQLGIKGVTNSYGDYTVDYIPYGSGGEIFRVTPTLGQHVFSPSSRSIFVGDGAKTHNGLDFTDISSFKVAGKVTYENSQVPVEGVRVLIDGEYALGSDNQPVRTDVNGDYEISVPIGRHYLTVEKDGHTFSEGIFPPVNAYGDIQTHEFVEEMIVNFIDDTKLIVSGRVVGGDREGDKEIGHGLSVNNIGVSEIEFKLQRDGYDLDILDPDLYNVVTAYTDPATGEYSIELIPEPWIVQKAGNDDYFIDPIDLGTVDISNSVLLKETYFEDTVSGDIDTFYYHHKLNYIIHSAPEITVTYADGSEFIGDTSIIFKDQETGDSDTLIVLSSTDTLFNYPVFQMGSTKDVVISVFESYKNLQHPTTPIHDYVPVTGADVTINDQIMVNPASSGGTTDENGEYAYQFRVGEPNLNQNIVTPEESYTKTFEVDVLIDGIGHVWRNGDTYRAYVLGSKPLEGTDFISYGPDVVEFVLRDPPGSNSYAYLEEGSSYSVAETWDYAFDTDYTMDRSIRTGVWLALGGGLAGPMSELQTITESELGMQIVREVAYDGKYKRSYTFNKRIETSSDPEDVGSMADVYVGKSYNVFVSESRNMKILDEQYCIDNGLDYVPALSGNKVLGFIAGITMDEGTQTYFAYSQKHILNDLIPDLVRVRNSLLRGAKYTSNLPFDHACYGLNNDDNSIKKYQDSILANYPETDTNYLSYTYLGTPGEDSVAYLNEQITQWINAIATNEAEKVEAPTQENVSIDGSTGAYEASLEERFDGEYNWVSRRTIGLSMNSSWTALANKMGTVWESTFDLDVGMSKGEENSTTKTMKFGYVIDERDEGDYYSIDIKKENGVKIFDDTDFSDNMPSSGEFALTQLATVGIAAGGLVGKKLISNVLAKVLSKSNIWIAQADFALDLAFVAAYELPDIIINGLKTIDKANGISGFNISSPIFSVRGGQSKCPYEGTETTSFYVDDNDESIELHTATLKREIPKIGVTPAIRNNVPESSQAVFTLQLMNESESSSDAWYDISIAENTNPDGAILLIDGLSAERSFLVPAWETLNKTLTIQKGASGVMQYDSIGIVLHSTCQFDPTNDQEDISDTVYVSVQYLPECTSVEVENFSDNWIINYEDGDMIPVTLGGYDINSATLDKIYFQYKSLSGSPVTVMTYFKDTNTVEYANYGGNKDKLEGGSVTFNWDVAALTDRNYQLIAVSSCLDGSTFESEYLEGVIDRVTPTVFGTPQPADGIYDPEDDILIKFNESIEEGLVKDHNISLKAVLNGSPIAHGTSIEFNGAGNYTEVPGVSLSGKSFTVEFWMKRNIGDQGSVFSFGSGSEKLEANMLANGTVDLTIGSNTFNFDPSAAYNVTYPEDGWHHWAFVYNNNDFSANVFVDDKTVLDEINLDPYQASNTSSFYLGQSSTGGNYFTGKIHELRIWEQALNLGDVYAQMSITLSGNEIGLYGYWSLEEGEGTLVIDKAAARNMSLNAAWSITPEGKAFDFVGGQFLTLDGNNIVINDQTDFTIEFWFKGNTPVAEATFFSNGKGDGSETAFPADKALSINANASGHIYVLSNGKQFDAVTTNYFDNNWHHFALTVDRRSNAKAYIDGALQNQTNVSNIDQLAGAKFFVGVRGEYVAPLTYQYDQYFNGSIDEVRVWNTVRRATHIDLYKNAKLQGDETGLLAYYPFEKYVNVMGSYLIQETLEDQLNSTFLVNGNIATANLGDSYTTVTPAIKDARPLQEVLFDFVTNNDEMVITPTIDMTRLEGQILEIVVSDIQDLNGNRMQSPVSWTAFVQRNEIVWQENYVSHEISSDSTLTFKVAIANLGGTPREFTLDNMPVWLSADYETGVISPNSTLDITFEVYQGLNVGTYEQGINLSTQLGYDEKLNIKIRVTEEGPEWTVDPTKFNYSMNIIGRLIVDDVVSTDELDQVAAFINGKCRGVANVEYVPSLDVYEVFLTVYSNAVDGQDIDFKVWDASTGTIREEVAPDTMFIADHFIGSPVNPIDIIATKTIGRTLELNKRWNWVSFNLNTTKLSSIDSLMNNQGEDGDIFKGQDGYDTYDASLGWLGGVTSNGGAAIEEMYKLKLSNDLTITYTGSEVLPSDYPIAVEPGWNFIGYVPLFNLTVDEALASLNPVEGDIVKSQTAFAMYSDPIGWIGTLTTMESGVGYMLSVSGNNTLIYPNQSSLGGFRANRYSKNYTLPAEWKLDETNYPNNMSLVGHIVNAEEYNLSGDEVLLAFEGENLLGHVGSISVAERPEYFITVMGQNSGTVTYKLYDQENNMIYDIEEETPFTNDAIIGSLNNSTPLTIKASRNLSESIYVTPNPFNESLDLNITLEETEDVTVKIVNMLGQVLVEKTYNNTTTGVLKLDFSKVYNMPKGAYVIKVSSASLNEEKVIIKE